MTTPDRWRERIEAVAGPHEKNCKSNNERAYYAFFGVEPPEPIPQCNCPRRDRIAAITKLLEAVEREALERAAQETCSGCRDALCGVALARYGEWTHYDASGDSRVTWECSASKLRALAESREG